MRYERNVTFSQKMILKAADRFMFRFLGKGYFVASALLLGALVFFLYCLPAHWLTFFLLTIVIGDVVITPLLFVVNRHRAARLFKRMSSPEVKFVIEDEGVSTESEMGTGNIKWPYIEKVWIYPDVWFLFVGGQYILIPTGRLGEDVKEFILGRLSKEGAKVF